MKNTKPYFLSAFFLVFSLACATVSNLFNPSQPESAVVLFEDSDFLDSCDQDSSAEVERFVENGRFMMRVISPSYVGWTECVEVEYDDFVMEVDASQVGGPDNNAYGVILRYGLEADEFYAFIISGDGYYAFTVDGAQRSEPEFLSEWAPSSAIRQGFQTNRLKVVAVGSNFKYYVNDQLLGETQDSRFTKGTVGFFAGSIGEGNVQIAFDNLKITKP